MMFEFRRALNARGVGANENAQKEGRNCCGGVGWQVKKFTRERIMDIRKVKWNSTQCFT